MLRLPFQQARRGLCYATAHTSIRALTISSTPRSSIMKDPTHQPISTQRRHLASPSAATRRKSPSRPSKPPQPLRVKQSVSGKDATSSTTRKRPAYKYKYRMPPQRPKRPLLREVSSSSPSTEPTPTPVKKSRKARAQSKKDSKFDGTFSRLYEKISRSSPSSEVKLPGGSELDGAEDGPSESITRSDPDSFMLELLSEEGKPEAVIEAANMPRVSSKAAKDDDSVPTSQFGTGFIVLATVDKVRPEGALCTVRTPRFHELKTLQDKKRLRAAKLSNKVCTDDDAESRAVVLTSKIHEPLDVGMQRLATVTRVTKFGLQISITDIGMKHLNECQKSIFEYLKKNRGPLGFTDKSDARVIQQKLHMSKVSFKRALGMLYKSRVVTLDPHITLTEKGKKMRDFVHIRKEQKSDDKQRTVHRTSVASTDARDLRSRSQESRGLVSSQERRRSFMVGNSGTRRETDASTSPVLRRRSRGKIKRPVR